MDKSELLKDKLRYEINRVEFRRTMRSAFRISLLALAVVLKFLKANLSSRDRNNFLVFSNQLKQSIFPFPNPLISDAVFNRGDFGITPGEKW